MDVRTIDHILKEAKAIICKDHKPKGSKMDIRKGQTQIKVHAGNENRIWVDLDQVADDYRRYIVECIEEKGINSPKRLVGFEDYVRGGR